MSEANKRQVGGHHYKDQRIEPWDYISQNGIGYLAGNAIKYLTRYKTKEGIADLRKAQHYIEKLIEEELKAPPQPGMTIPAEFQPGPVERRTAERRAPRACVQFRAPYGSDGDDSYCTVCSLPKNQHSVESQVAFSNSVFKTTSPCPHFVRKDAYSSYCTCGWSEASHKGVTHGAS